MSFLGNAWKQVSSVGQYVNPIASGSFDWLTGQDSILGKSGIGAGPQFTDTRAMDSIAARMRERQNRLAAQEASPVRFKQAAATHAPMQIHETPTIDRSEDMRAQAAAIGARLSDQTNHNAGMAQHRLATDRGLKQAMALAQSQNNPLAYRHAADAQGEMQARAALQGATIAAQDQRSRNAALSGAASIFGQQRSQDIGASTNQAGLDMRRQLANQKALHEAGMFNAKAKNERAHRETQLEMANRAQENKAFLDNVNMEMRAYDTKYRTNAADRGTVMQGLAGVAQGVGAGAAAYFSAGSDKKFKKNTKPVTDKDIDSFLSSLKGFTFDYKDAARHGEGRRMGPMAQDLERSPIGKAAVSNEADGKYVDYSKLIPAMLAVLARHDDKLKG